MRMVRPITITDAILLSSNVAETDYAAYVAGTTYALAARVIVVATHKIYESAQAGNVGHYPPDNLAGATPYWLEVGATNRWRMLDGKVGSQTTNADTIELALDTSEQSSVNFLQLEAASLLIEVTDNTTSTVVYSETFSLISDKNIIDGWTYFFEPFIFTRNRSVGIPLLADSTTAITISNLTGTAKCGEVLIGNSTFIAPVAFGAELGLTDYSVPQVDDFGNYSYLQRSWSKRGTFSLQIDNNRIEYILDLFADIRTVPVLWIPDDGEKLRSSLMVYGIYKAFSTVISYPQLSMCSLEIDGLI